MLNKNSGSHEREVSLKKRVINRKELPFIVFYFVISMISAYFVSAEFNSDYLQWVFVILLYCLGIGIFCLTFACVLYGIKSFVLVFRKESQFKAISSLKSTSFSLLTHVILFFLVYLIFAIADSFFIN